MGQFSTHFPHAVSHFLVFFCSIIMFSYFLVQLSMMIQANYLYTCNLMYLQMFLNRKNLFLSHRFPPDTVLRICTVTYHFLLFRCHCLRRTHCRPAVIWAALFARNLIALENPLLYAISVSVASPCISRIACARRTCVMYSRNETPKYRGKLREIYVRIR